MSLYGMVSVKGLHYSTLVLARLTAYDCSTSVAKRYSYVHFCSTLMYITCLPSKYPPQILKVIDMSIRCQLHSIVETAKV